jgi:uncharacterized membrane protein
MRFRDEKRLEIAMGHMLRFGSTIAASVVLAGGVLYLMQFHGPIPDYRHFHGAPLACRSLGPILKGLGESDSQSIIACGIVVLIATPVCRVIFGMVGFLLQRDRLYVAVSVIVLAILLTSFFARR